MKEDIIEIYKRIDSLESKINLIVEKMQFHNNSEKKVDISDLTQIYEEKNFETFYETCRNYGRSIDEDTEEQMNWDVDCTNGESTMSRVVQCLMYFDLDNIADDIVAINSLKIDSDKKIKSVDVGDVLNKYQWKACLMNCLKNVIEELFKHGEADENITYKEFQSGRIHLESILMKYEDETANRLNLYWTNSDTQGQPDVWG